MNNEILTSKKRGRFNEKYKDFSDTELLKEYIYNQELTYSLLERIRGNTSKIVWFLIVIPLIVLVIVVLTYGLVGMAS